MDDRSKRVAGFEVDVFRELTNGRYVTLGRSELSHLLFEKAAGTSEVMFDNEIVSLEDRERRCVRSIQTRARAPIRSRGRRRWSAFTGSQTLFGPQHQFERNLGYAVAAFEVSGYRPRDEDVYVMYGRPGRSLGRFTMRENRTLFLFVFATGNDALPETLDGQKELLLALYANDKWECRHILDELKGTQELYFDRVSQIRMPSWSRGRVALVGDAAFCVSLLAGQGSALAMTSAYVLAGELAKAGGRHDVAFREYEAFLRAYIETKQAGAARFGGALAPKTQWGLWFRNQVMNAFTIPGLARLAIGREITDKLLLRDYCWQRAHELAAE